MKQHKKKIHFYYKCKFCYIIVFYCKNTEKEFLNFSYCMYNIICCIYKHEISIMYMNYPIQNVLSKKKRTCNLFYI